ncbi:MAG: hypothetical protein AAF988_00505 [Pseudomonadota bacterium]
MKFVALRINKKSFSHLSVDPEQYGDLDDETYSSLKAQFEEHLKEAFEGPKIGAALHLELTGEKEAGDVYLLKLDDDAQAEPNFVRNALLKDTQFNDPFTVTSTVPEFAKTNPFDVVPYDGETHSFTAIQMIRNRERPSKALKEDTLWHGDNIQHGLNNLFEGEEFVFNLASKARTWLAVMNYDDPADIVSDIHKSDVGDSLREQQALFTRENTTNSETGGWAKLSSIASTLPGQDNPSNIQSLKIKARHLTF